MTNGDDPSPWQGFPEVPPELIAQAPPARRDQARLMVVHRKGGAVEGKRFDDLPGFIAPGDVLVLNDVRVFPARLIGRKPTGGRVKVLLLRRLAGGAPGDRWAALLTPPLDPGAVIHFPEGLTARTEGRLAEGEHGLLFSRALSAEDISRLGRMPLPPYIRRAPEDAAAEASDRRGYQTVFARPEGPLPSEGAPGAVAAPTAGLHFTEEVLAAVLARGAEVAFLSLKVGWGTFRPVQQDDYRRHRMMSEEYDLPEAAARAVNRARKERKRVWAVGTTVVRTLESAADEEGRVRPGPGATELYIHPGHRFRAVDVLVTNFHLPRHTPLLLASAFAGEELLRRAYRTAIQEGYRFFSYGDAMLIL